MLKSYLRKHLAQNHIAGSDLQSALRICELISSKGWSTTISLWAKQDEDKKSVAENYINIIKAISKNNLNSYLSIKPSALKFDLRLFEFIAKNIYDNKIRIHFDSLSPDLADRSLQYFEEVKSIYDNVGYTLPARWLRSFDDAEKISGMKIPVRIVKGQWQDPDDFKNDVETNFLKIINILRNKSPMISIATHDTKLAMKAIDILKNSKSNFELEQFFSLPIIEKTIKSHYENINTRVYIAYGKPYLPYNLKNINERPAMITWFIFDLFGLKRRLHPGLK